MSAGSKPTGQVHPRSLALPLDDLALDPQGLKAAMDRIGATVN
jgi:hypothetical protein